MIKENGHEWDAISFSMGNQKLVRCNWCQMKYGYYLDIKRASREQPERQDLKDWMKCDKNPDSLHSTKKEEKD